MTPARIPAGKYRGQAINNVPQWYLEYMLREWELKDPLREAITDLLGKYDQQRRPDRKVKAA